MSRMTWPSVAAYGLALAAVAAGVVSGALPGWALAALVGVAVPPPWHRAGNGDGGAAR